MADALREAGCRVELLADHFPPNTPDADWAPAVGRRGWIILTKDKNIRRRTLEIRALLNSGTPCFVLTSGNTTGLENARAFRAALPEMMQQIERKPAPFIATVSARGKVLLFLTLAELIKRS